MANHPMLRHVPAAQPTRRGDLIDRLVLSVLFAYGLALALPATFLTGNHSEIQFGLDDLAYLLRGFAVSLLVSAAIVLALGRWHIFNRASYALIASLLLIAVFSPNQTGALDGIRDAEVFALSARNWMEAAKLALIFCLAYWAFGRFADNARLVTWLLLAASLGMWGYLIFEMQAEESSRASELRLATLSTRQNVILISFDGLQGDVVEEVLGESPELELHKNVTQRLAVRLTHF